MRITFRQYVLIIVLLCSFALRPMGWTQENQQREKPTARVTIDIEPKQSSRVPVVINVVLENLTGSPFSYYGVAPGRFALAELFYARLTLPNGDTRIVRAANGQFIRWRPSYPLRVEPEESTKTPLLLTLSQIDPKNPWEMEEKVCLPFEHVHFEPGIYSVVIVSQEMLDTKSKGRVVLWPGGRSPEATFAVTDDEQIRDKRLTDLADPTKFPKEFQEHVRRTVVSPEKVLEWYKKAVTADPLEARKALGALYSLTTLDDRACEWLSKAMYARLAEGQFTERLGGGLPAAYTRGGLFSTIAELLGKTGDPKAADPLIALARSHAEPIDREPALWALAGLKQPKVTGTLIELLGDPNERIRIKAAGALSRHGRTEGRELLIRHATDKKSRWRKYALVALSWNEKDPRADSLIEAVLREEDEDFVADVKAMIRDSRRE